MKCFKCGSMDLKTAKRSPPGWLEPGVWDRFLLTCAACGWIETTNREIMENPHLSAEAKADLDAPYNPRVSDYDRGARDMITLYVEIYHDGWFDGVKEERIEKMMNMFRQPRKEG